MLDLMEFDSARDLKRIGEASGKPIIRVADFGDAICKYKQNSLGELLGLHISRIAEVPVPEHRGYWFRQGFGGVAGSEKPLGGKRPKDYRVGLFRENVQIAVYAREPKLGPVDRVLYYRGRALQVLARGGDGPRPGQNKSGQLTFTRFSQMFLRLDITTTDACCLKARLKMAAHEYECSFEGQFERLFSGASSRERTGITEALDWLCKVPQRQRAEWIILLNHPMERLLSKFHAHLLGHRLNLVGSRLGIRSQEIEDWENSLEQLQWNESELVGVNEILKLQIAS